ncbi:hypothetical protein J2X85_003804 [Microbacterium trichothecenolyticum]|nr:hypothetical protein [Microbacterium trichothecenolyticum]
MESERVEEGEQVGSERPLLSASGRVRAQEARRTVSAKVGHENAEARLDEERSHVGITVDVVRESVQQHDGFAA